MMSPRRLISPLDRRPPGWRSTVVSFFEHSRWLVFYRSDRLVTIKPPISLECNDGAVLYDWALARNGKRVRLFVDRFAMGDWQWEGAHTSLLAKVSPVGTPFWQKSAPSARRFSMSARPAAFSRHTLRADLLAGLSGALIILSQGAIIAGLPPQYGLYAPR